MKTATDPDPPARLIGRANEAKIEIDGVDC